MGLEKERFGEPVEWFLDDLRHRRGASEHTVAAYANDLNRAANTFQEQGFGDWTELNNEALHRYQSKLGENASVATRQRRLSSLRTFLKFLKQRGQGPDAELPELSTGRKPKRLPKALTLEQLAALLSAPDLSQASGYRDRALMELIYGAGLRVAEAVSLRTDEVDLDVAALRVTGKRQKVRWVPLPRLTLPWLETYVEEMRPKLLKGARSEVFISDRGKAMSRQIVYNRLQRYAKNAGLPGVSPHVLRHTYAVHLVQGGADLRTVQELLGHASIATTQIYTELDRREVAEKYRKAHPRP
jgi:integrase/recombinase XerD